MHFAHTGGILLHPTSLPGKYGIGDLGESANRFLGFLNHCGLQLWQVLPLGPTGFGNSPYQSLSAFAGNPMLISLETLVQENLLSENDLAAAPKQRPERIDYGAVIPFVEAMLAQAYTNFRTDRNHSLVGAYEDFRHRHAFWLAEYALFRAIKKNFGGGAWLDWPVALIHREPRVLQQWREKLRKLIDATVFEQFLFFRQWQALKARAGELGVQIIGDIPIFAAHDSADVWANQECFYLDENGRPEVVAGVPPDYFSETGQLWGNPLYRWQVMAAHDYSWWKTRMKHTLQMVDVVRIDHFRGFEAYWEIPGDAETAVNGRWVKGPGEALFHALQSSLGELPIIAEDLGVITPEVEALRDRFDFPGMKILQFAFDGDSSNEYLPHNYLKNCVVYTGTHDNDTFIGWLEKARKGEKAQAAKVLARESDFALKYMGCDAYKDLHWAFIRLAFASVADMAIVPLQDVLGLDNAARMNEPGNPEGNWEWRFQDGDLSDEIAGRLSELALLYGRAKSG